LIPYLNGEEPGPSPAGLLAEGASEMGEQGQSLALIRMAEVALLADRRDLVDTPALAGLAFAASTSWGAQYDQVFRWLVKSLSDDEFLSALDDPGPRYLLQILLTRRPTRSLSTKWPIMGGCCIPRTRRPIMRHGAPSVRGNGCPSDRH